MPRERADWIDGLKLIGMFYIYIGHLGPAAGKIYPFVFTFHVPLFFFISGLLYKNCGTLSDLLGIVRRNVRRILVPYAIFSIIGIAVFTVKSTLPTPRVLEMVVDALLGIRNQVPITSLWFLPCLFVVIFYHSTLQLVVRKLWLAFAVSFLIYQLKPYWGTSMPSVAFNLDSALYYLVFYSAGTLVSDLVIRQRQEFTAAWAKPLVYVTVLASLVLFAYSYQYSAYSLLAWTGNEQVKSAVFFIITCALFVPSIVLSHVLRFPALYELGRNSLVLCGTEQILKVMLPTFLLAFGIQMEINDPLQAVLYTCLLLTVSYFTIIRIYSKISAAPHAVFWRDHVNLS